jgi:hypothetical protein
VPPVEPVSTIVYRSINGGTLWRQPSSLCAAFLTILARPVVGRAVPEAPGGGGRDVRSRPTPGQRRVAGGAAGRARVVSTLVLSTFSSRAKSRARYASPSV